MRDNQFMDINQQLYRKIKSGFEYDSLIPKTTCQPTQVGKGMTDFSVDRMVDVVKKYGDQAEKVAKKLQSSSLEKTCQNIHQFIYWHFAYKADTDDQLLRSFACSWYDRKNGIDCKSYSIAASSLLSSLGIKHYIRKIKQPSFAPTEWTHVYVVVPKNQTTGSLSQGYFTIDGTLADFDREPKFNLKKDKQMMNHVMLNGSRLNSVQNVIGQGQQIYQTGQAVAAGANKAREQLKGLSQAFNKFKNFVGNLFGSAGWYGANEANGVHDQIFNHFKIKTETINALLRSPDFKRSRRVLGMNINQTLNNEVSKFLCHCKLIADSYQAKRSEGWSRETNRNLDATVYMASFYKDAVYKAMVAWLNDNFTRGAVIGQQSCTMAGWEQGGKWKGSFTGGQPVITEGSIYNLIPKKPVAQIPDFVINQFLMDQYTAKANNNAQTNIAGYLDMLQTAVGVAQQFVGGGTSTPTANTGTYETIDIDGTKTAGASVIMKVAVVGVLGTIAYNYFTKKA